MLIRYKDMLSSHGIEMYHFGHVKPNPSYETVKSGVGGFIIDAGKAIALLTKLGGDVEDYLYPRAVDKFEIMPIVAVPTTCETGGEVTRYSLLTDIKTG